MRSISLLIVALVIQWRDRATDRIVWPSDGSNVGVYSDGEGEEEIDEICQGGDAGVGGVGLRRGDPAGGGCASAGGACTGSDAGVSQLRQRCSEGVGHVHGGIRFRAGVPG